MDVDDGREISFANTEVGGSGDGMRCNGGMALKRPRSTSAMSRLFGRFCASRVAARKSDCAASAEAVTAVVET